MKAYGLPLTDDHDNCFGICITEDGKYLGQWTSSSYSWLERDLKTHADGYDYEFKQKPDYMTLVQLLIINGNLMKDAYNKIS